MTINRTTVKYGSPQNDDDKILKYPRITKTIEKGGEDIEDCVERELTGQVRFKVQTKRFEPGLQDGRIE